MKTPPPLCEYHGLAVALLVLTLPTAILGTIGAALVGELHIGIALGLLMVEAIVGVFLVRVAVGKLY